MGFFDVRPSYLDTLDEEQDTLPVPRARRFRDSGNVADERTAIQQTAPQTMGYAERFGRGVLHDVGELGQALTSPIYYGAREAYRAAKDPAAEFQKAHDVITKVAADPYGTVERAGKAVISSLAEPYQRREGEGFTDVIARNVLDRPLGTLMDVSAAIGIPAGLAERAGITGAKVFADAAAKLDPLTVAGKLGRGALQIPDAARTLGAEGPVGLAKAMAEGRLRTSAPDAMARLEASRSLTDLAATAKTRATAVHNEFAGKAAEVFQGLEPAEKALFFPYVEGRLKTLTEGPESGMVGELTPEGVWAPRGIDPGRLQRLEQARQSYLPILDEFEQQMGYHPEQFAGAATEKKIAELTKAGTDPLGPEGQQAIMDAHQSALDEAMAAQQARRTLSTRTSLNAQKTQEFNAKVEALKMEKGVAAANDYASRYPVTPATPEEAMQVWGPQGGLYFPHSGEVFTRDQVTMGNVLTKVRESVPWKQNKAALYRSGALEQMDPEKALLRTHMALQGGMGRAEIFNALGEKLVEQGHAEKLAPGYKFGTDADLRAGTHQIFRPGLLHQEAALGEHLTDLVQALLKHADDPAVASMNLQDVMEQAAKGMDHHFPLNSEAPIYKIRKGAADSIAAFTKSFEPSTNPITPWLDKTVDPFNFITLNLRPARILNNVVGNTMFQVLQGIHPFSTTGIGAISDMVKAVAYKAGLTSSEQAGKLAQVFELPGVKTGGLSAQYESRTSELLKNHPLAKLLGGKQLAAYGETMGRLNEHVENTARALSTLFELRKQSPGLLARMASTAKTTVDLGDRLTELAGQGARALDDASYAGALKNVNRFLNDYGRTSAFERTTLRRVFPYHKFYKHSLDLALKTPFEQPAKTALLRTLGKAAQQDFHETLQQWGFDPVSMVPPWLQTSVPIDIQDAGDGRGPHVRMINLQGPSPFSLLSAASSGDPGREGLAALHPAIKAALEVATGINLFTMQPFQGPTTTFAGKEVDPFTGLTNQATVRPGPISQFAKQFFPVQIARDLVAGGRKPFDSASLLSMIHAAATGHEGEAFQVNDRGEALRRPVPNPFLRLLGPVTTDLEAPTKQQLQGQKSTVTEAYRKLGRAGGPEVQQQLTARRRAAAEIRRQQPRPYRVKPRRES